MRISDALFQCHCYASFHIDLLRTFEAIRSYCCSIRFAQDYTGISYWQDCGWMQIGSVWLKHLFDE